MDQHLNIKTKYYEWESWMVQMADKIVFKGQKFLHIYQVSRVSWCGLFSFVILFFVLLISSLLNFSTQPPTPLFFLNQSYLFLVNIWVVFFASSLDKDACKERFLMLWTKYKKVCLFPHSLYLYFDHTSIFFIAHLQWLA